MFIPPGEKIIETRKCRISGEDFVITEKDADMYEKIAPVFAGKKCSIPFPTLCPNERQMRRMMWRNYDHFYKNTCFLTWKEVITNYKSWTPYRVVTLDTWWWDSWNPFEYSKKVDFSRSFFEQFHELDQITIHLPLSVVNSENSDFTNFSINNHNCYLCARIAECEDCYYSFLITRCRHCVDCANLTDSEYLYECIRTTKSYRCFSCVDCENCQDSYLLQDCTGCQDCFGSCNLRNARFVFNNQQLAESVYREKLSQTLNTVWDFWSLREKFSNYCSRFPKKYMSGYGNEGCFGNYLFSNSGVIYGFECYESQNVRYAYWSHNVTDAIDMTFGYMHQKSLEIAGWTGGYNQLFSVNNLTDCRDLLYSKDCALGTTDSFGCVSLKKGKHCILNTPYSHQEYETTVLKLIDHMRSTGEWWEFFPWDYSPFTYNESSAQVHFPLTKEKVHERDCQWYEAPIEQKKSDFVPLPIDQYDEKIVWYALAKEHIDQLLSETFVCIQSGKSYRILRQELAFYIENHLPIPRLHPSIRSEARLRQTLPIELYARLCDECWQAFHTSYAPGRPEKILCEECYRKLVY